MVFDLAVLLEMAVIGAFMSNLAGKSVLMVLAPTNFRDEEYKEPRRIFEDTGATVKVASKGVTEASGSFGLKATVDLDVYQASADDYDAVVFVGGQGSSIYFDDQRVLKLAEDFHKQNKVIGAICIAPSILTNARILAGKRATAFDSEENNLTEKGAIYTGEDVTVDGKVVTASGPAATEEFGKAVVKVISTSSSE